MLEALGPERTKRFGKEAYVCKGPGAEMKNKARKGCRADPWVRGGWDQRE